MRPISINAIMMSGVVVVGIAIAGNLLAATETQTPITVLGSYATGLEERSRSQRHNAQLAAARLNGAVIAPGAVLSFNKRIGAWDEDGGYVRAPVSYSGEMIRALGGGVCQTSTTLYNAALLAGLEIVERHPHTHRAHYAPPGCDAAVAYPNIDLQLRNPFRNPVTVTASADEGRLEVSINGRKSGNETYDVDYRVMSTAPPNTRLRQDRTDGVSVLRRYRGVEGGRVVTYRIVRRDGKVVKRERLGDDSYESLHGLVWLGR